MYQLAVNFPIHNEEKSILTVLNEWKSELDKLKIDYCLILSEDGSTDNTKDILKKFILENEVAIDNMVDEKRGYTGAVLSGIKKIDAKFILCVDSDGQCDPTDFAKFWKKRLEFPDHVILGIRHNRRDTKLRLLCSKFFKLFHYFLFPSNIIDPSCPFVLFEKKFLNRIDIHLNYVVEAFWWLFVAACIKEKISIHQVTINHKDRLFGETQVYKLQKFPVIFLKNLIGLIKLRFSKRKII